MQRHLIRHDLCLHHPPCCISALSSVNMREMGSTALRVTRALWGFPGREECRKHERETLPCLIPPSAQGITIERYHCLGYCSSSCQNRHSPIRRTSQTMQPKRSSLCMEATDFVRLRITCLVTLFSWPRSVQKFSLLGGLLVAAKSSIKLLGQLFELDF